MDIIKTVLPDELGEEKAFGKFEIYNLKGPYFIKLYALHLKSERT